MGEKKQKLWIWMALLILIFLLVLVTEDLLDKEINAFDKWAAGWFKDASNSILEKLAVVFYYIGTAYVEIPIALLAVGYLLLKQKDRWAAGVLAGSLAGSFLLSWMMKMLLKRERPGLEHLVKADGYSFPSGHSMVGLAFYGTLCYLLYLNLKEKGKSTWHVLLIGILLVGGIGLSCVLSRVHYASDVIAGLIGGGIWLLASILVLEYKRTST
ncbi:phosphatase PAP2 family protein [Ammoniphilus sp. YIM 78166]|uniref:phosphatase PAP2 family protein n=1 Tax=Ammoniphilus sp. YIM 78166 TaxID=1644106 RepID=UPI001070578D|nr:phosphatase PAP2 family protein [Ammoniphilus sp. YIM 78166]